MNGWSVTYQGKPVTWTQWVELVPEERRWPLDRLSPQFDVAEGLPKSTATSILLRLIDARLERPRDLRLVPSIPHAAR
jgi:hypothetical protein